MKITRSQLRRLIKEELSLLVEDEDSTSPPPPPKIKSINRVPGKPRESKVTLADNTVVPHLDVGMTVDVPEGRSHPKYWKSGSSARVSIKVDDTWYKYTKANPDGVVDSERMDRDRSRRDRPRR